MENNINNNDRDAFLINGINISHNPYDHVLVALYSMNPTLELEGQLEAYGVFPFNSNKKQKKAIIEAYLLFKEKSEDMKNTLSNNTKCDEIDDNRRKSR